MSSPENRNANGDNPLLRIALCGYEGEHEMPADWAIHSWSAGEGFGGQAKERSHNGKRMPVGAPTRSVCLGATMSAEACRACINNYVANCDSARAVRAGGEVPTFGRRGCETPDCLLYMTANGDGATARRLAHIREMMAGRAARGGR